MATSGIEAERLHELTRAVETVAAEPSHQLLRAVRSEGETNNESHDQKSEVHNTFSFCINRLFSAERSDAGERRRRRLPRAAEPPAASPESRGPSMRRSRPFFVGLMLARPSLINLRFFIA